MNLRPADYEEVGTSYNRQVSRRNLSVFTKPAGQGSRSRTYAELGRVRLAGSVAVSGRFLSDFPDRTSEPRPNGSLVDSQYEIAFCHAQERIRRQIYQTRRRPRRISLTTLTCSIIEKGGTLTWVMSVQLSLKSVPLDLTEWS